VKLFRLSAAQGLLRAEQARLDVRQRSRCAAELQNKLGWMYANGRGVLQNYAEALKWYRLAAAQGNEFAQHNLGGLYNTGVGVPQSYVQAYMWYSLSAANGHQDARDNRDKVALFMTPAQIAEAQKLTREWKPRSPRIARVEHTAPNRTEKARFGFLRVGFESHEPRAIRRTSSMTDAA
jgi:TPR repeat protein